MANKTNFSPDEWNQARRWRLYGRFCGDGSGPERTVGPAQGDIRQRARALEAKSSATGSELMKTIVGDLETAEGRSAGRDYVKTRMEGVKREEIRAKAIEGIRQAASIVEAKAPADAQAYKDWLLHVSENVAAASTEGGFLGFGGVAVSDAEKATLAEIRTALGR